MATFKGLVLRHHNKQDNTFNVKIRVTHKGRSKYIATNLYVDKTNLTKTFKIKDSFILDKINEITKLYRDRCNEISTVLDNMTVDEVVTYITKESFEKDVNFFDFADEYIQELNKKGRTGTAGVYEIAVKSFENFIGSRVLMFSDFKKSVVTSYINSMTESGNFTNNTIISKIAGIQTVYNKAKDRLNKEEYNIVIVKWSAFANIELPRGTSANIKRALSVEEIQKIIDLPYREKDSYSNFKYNLTKDLFVFSFCMLGINLADIMLLKSSDYKNGVLSYYRKKTFRKVGEDAFISVKANNVADTIIKKYSDNKSEYIFDISNRYSVMYYMKMISEDSGIDNVVFYSARHSMATIARNVCGIDKYTVHEMLNHASNQDMKTTDIYLTKDYSLIWKANEKLLALFDWEFYKN